MKAASLDADLKRLFSRRAHEIKLGLETETALLDALGNPQLRMAHIHVAGTNGKGSVCAMIESILRAAGCRTGLYTSPHLVRFNERIRVAGECISDDELAGLFREIEAHDQALAAKPGGRLSTFFEFTTALALEHFRRKGVEVAVLETGMGGRLDATNVVAPLVSVITRIDIEHTEFLGHTIEKIAAEKGGIIKSNRPIIHGPMPDEARDVIRSIAAERKAPLMAAEDIASVRRVSQSLTGQKLKVETASCSYGTVVLPLLGKYQMENMVTVAAVIEYLNNSSPLVIDGAAFKAGVQGLCWPARCQILSTDPVVVLDVAHNPNAARSLAEALKDLAKGKEVALVTSLLADKDCRGFMAAFSPGVGRCWAVQIHNERAKPLPELIDCIRNAGMQVTGAELGAAMDEAKAWARENGGVVCIAGSLFLAGEVLAASGRQNLFA